VIHNRPFEEMSPGLFALVITIAPRASEHMVEELVRAICRRWYKMIEMAASRVPIKADATVGAAGFEIRPYTVDVSSPYNREPVPARYARSNGLLPSTTSLGLFRSYSSLNSSTSSRTRATTAGVILRSHSRPSRKTE
jgi:hypothetical protein